MVKSWTELENVRGFVLWNTTANGQAKHTSETVAHEEFRFWRWYHLDKNIRAEQVTAEHCQEYIAFRMVTPARNKTRPPHPDTIRSIRNRLKFYWDYLVMIGYVESNPWLNVKGPRSEVRYVEPPTDDQITEILQAAGRVGRNPRMKARNKAIVFFLVHTGVRCNELVRLTRSDIQNPDGSIRHRAKVYGKGSKERLVGVNEPTRLVLAEYLDQRIDVSEHAFIGGDGYPISNVLVRSMMQRVKAELNRVSRNPMKTLGTHDLRRWHFNKMASIGVPYNQIKEVGGWSTDSAMRHYIYFGTADVAAKNHSELDLTKAERLGQSAD